MEAPTVISARTLTKHYRDLIAVDGISFAIRRCECFGFLAPKGEARWAKATPLLPTQNLA